VSKLNSYADALYHVKQGFLIFGLTGYTGSGCTSAARLLTRKDFIFPVEMDAESIEKKLVSEKINRELSGRPYLPFVHIEVSKLLYVLRVYFGSQVKKDDEAIVVAKKIGKLTNPQIALLKVFVDEKFEVSSAQAVKVLESYEKVTKGFGAFKNSFEKSKGQSNLNIFVKEMQDLGDNLRRYGTAFPNNETKELPDALYLVPEAIRRLIKLYRVGRSEKHFVVDAFRNPFEVEFFQRRYNEFYLVGIQRSISERHAALAKAGMSNIFIAELDKRERGKLAEGAIHKLCSQDIDECMRKANLFIENRDQEGFSLLRFRYWFGRFIALAKNPGCVPPTKDEFCMQIAVTGKHVSGCLSRRVGAAVAGSDGFVSGIGWNDPPENQVPCSLRTCQELIVNANSKLFSTYERSDEFVSAISKKPDHHQPFCFKDEYSKIKSNERYAEFTRSLHAEENALFQACRNVGQDIHGSTLYTTDRTCNLCAKKAYQLGVSRIVFVEDYTDIAIDQTIKAGYRAVVIEKFEGVLGSSYFKLYVPLMPEKDIMNIKLASQTLKSNQQ